jgi:hypothetical protein
MKPLRPHFAAFFAAVLLLSHTVSGRLIFKAYLVLLHAPAIGVGITGSLVDNGQSTCSINQGTTNPPLLPINTVVFDCITGYSLSFTVGAPDPLKNGDI